MPVYNRILRAKFFFFFFLGKQIWAPFAQFCPQFRNWSKTGFMLAVANSTPWLCSMTKHMKKTHQKHALPKMSGSVPKCGTWASLVHFLERRNYILIVLLKNSTIKMLCKLHSCAVSVVLIRKSASQHCFAICLKAEQMPRTHLLGVIYDTAPNFVWPRLGSAVIKAWNRFLRAPTLTLHYDGTKHSITKGNFFVCFGRSGERLEKIVSLYCCLCR